MQYKSLLLMSSLNSPIDSFSTEHIITCAESTSTNLSRNRNNWKYISIFECSTAISISYPIAPSLASSKLIIPFSQLPILDVIKWLELNNIKYHDENMVSQYSAIQYENYIVSFLGFNSEMNEAISLCCAIFLSLKATDANIWELDFCSAAIQKVEDYMSNNPLIKDLSTLVFKPKRY